MTPLDLWRDLAREENARMREVCCVVNTSDIETRRAEAWAMRQRGLTMAEIAEALECPMSTIRTDLYKMRHKA